MIDRRTLLSLLPLSAAALVAGGCSRTSNRSSEASRYSPMYFTRAEWEFITAAVGRLIPHEGEGPGAVAAGVPEFIDRQLELPYGYGAHFYMQGPFIADAEPTLGYQLSFTPREIYRFGIADGDALAREQHGNDFSLLTSAQQDELLGRMEHGELQFAHVPAAVFFAQVLQNTREGYFADPQYGGNRDMMAWRWIGFPGARADFTDWIDRAGSKYLYGPVSIAGNT